MIPPVRQELDASRLHRLSGGEQEAADELGELDGNQHYLDLSGATWADVAYALDAEAKLMRELAGSRDADAAFRRLQESRDPEDERDALWHLDLGVAAPVMALNALGAHTALSCNGGAFGGNHLRPFPSIRFYPQGTDVELLLSLARDSGVGLVEEEGRALLYAPSVHDLQRFAALALARHGDG